MEMSSVILSLVTRPDQEMWISWLFLRNIEIKFLKTFVFVRLHKKVPKMDWDYFCRGHPLVRSLRNVKVYNDNVYWQPAGEKCQYCC